MSLLILTRPIVERTSGPLRRRGGVRVQARGSPSGLPFLLSNLLQTQKEQQSHSQGHLEEEKGRRGRRFSLCQSVASSAARRSESSFRPSRSSRPDCCSSIGIFLSAVKRSWKVQVRLLISTVMPYVFIILLCLLMLAGRKKKVLMLLKLGISVSLSNGPSFRFHLSDIPCFGVSVSHNSEELSGATVQAEVSCSRIHKRQINKAASRQLFPG